MEILLLILLVIAGHSLFKERSKQIPYVPVNIMIGQNTLIGNYNPNLPLKISVVGDLIGDNDPNYLLWHIEEKYPELYKIIECESTFRSSVCSYAGCNAGQGLAQIIPSTLLYCEEKLKKHLDVFNPTDNLECAIWLYTQEGNRHWNSSKECWGK